MFYVYAYLRKSDNTPYYIGKGQGRSAYEVHTVSVPKDRSKIVFLETNLTNIGALAIERRMIRWYGRKDLGTGILRNRTDGGEGTAGIISHRKNGTIPQSVKNKISNSTVGKKKSEETKNNMRKPKAKDQCPHCNKIGGVGGLNRWHFDNCKEKK
jgi:hypothetical protein